jgi:chromosome segregation ATPase
MDATAELTDKPTREDYTSRPGALIWFFRKSRDGWKKKYQDLKATIKGFKNQIAAVTKSREQWRLKAEQSSERVSALEAEVTELRAQAAASADKKNGRGKRPAEAQPGRAVETLWSAI